MVLKSDDSSRKLSGASESDDSSKSEVNHRQPSPSLLWDAITEPVDEASRPTTVVEQAHALAHNASRIQQCIAEIRLLARKGAKPLGQQFVRSNEVSALQGARA